MRRVLHMMMVMLGVLIAGSARAYHSSDEILAVARREGQSVGPRAWQLPAARCRALIDFSGAAERCTVRAAANNLAAFVSLTTDCSEDFCAGHVLLSIAKSPPRALPDAFFGDGMEYLPSLDAIVVDQYDPTAHHQRDVHVIRFDLKTAQSTPFAACESPVLSPKGRWIVCRRANGDVMRVSVQGGATKRVYRSPLAAASLDHGAYPWRRHPAVEFSTPYQMRVTTRVRDDANQVVFPVAWDE